MAPSRTLALLAMILGFGVASGSIQTVPPTPTFTLRWKPKMGEIHIYQVKVKFDFSGNAVQFNSNLKVKVVAVSDDGGYSIQTSTTDATIDSGDEVKNLPPQPPVTQYYTKVGLPTGPSLANRDPDPFSDMLDHLTEFESPIEPVKVKDSWVNKATGPKTGIFGAPRLTYTLVDVFRDGMRHMAKIRYQASVATESDAASGTLILDRINNSLSQLDASIPRFKPDGASEEATVSISLREKETS